MVVCCLIINVKSMFFLGAIAHWLMMHSSLSLDSTFLPTVELDRLHHPTEVFIQPLDSNGTTLFMDVLVNFFPIPAEYLPLFTRN